jgi:Domain of unknown function (DUF4476)
MKKIFPLLFLLLICIAAKAQQNYFVYVQTDNKQPFYIKMNDKLMSSSAAGYLVIPKLTTGTYNLMVGFPKDQWVQQSFKLSIGTSDAGYLLKNFGEKGWGLYNIQTMEVFMNGESGSSVVKSTSENTDAFAATLSGATNTNLSTPKETNPAPVKEIAPKVVEKPAKSVIQKIQTVNDDDGKTFVYTDNNNNKIDTIRIFVPITKEPSQKVGEAIKEETVKVEPAKTEIVKAEPVKDKKFLDIELQNPNEKVVDAAPKVNGQAVPVKKEEPMSSPVVEPAKKEKPLLTFNSDCKSNATEDDFFKARKKMVAEDSDDAMVEVARKLFKQKCYTVEQIKNLSTLFLKDEGKYKFFDAVYPYTSDTQNFLSLQSLLKDEYFINRFKAMIRN